MKMSKLPRKEYELSEEDFLEMMCGYLEYKRRKGVFPKFWFDKGDYVLTLRVKAK